MEQLASLADDKAVKIGLRGVNVDIYKVLKLVKLAPRFCFLTEVWSAILEESCHAASSRQRSPFLGETPFSSISSARACR